jgi:hypothetical protein
MLHTRLLVGVLVAAIAVAVAEALVAEAEALVAAAEATHMVEHLITKNITNHRKGCNYLRSNSIPYIVGK